MLRHPGKQCQSCNEANIPYHIFEKDDQWSSENKYVSKITHKFIYFKIKIFSFSTACSACHCMQCMSLHAVHVTACSACHCMPLPVSHCHCMQCMPLPHAVHATATACSACHCMQCMPLHIHQIMHQHAAAFFLGGGDIFGLIIYANHFEFYMSVVMI
jgi:hypothetical protein